MPLEYRVLTFNISAQVDQEDLEVMENKLNDFADQGWQLVSQSTVHNVFTYPDHPMAIGEGVDTEAAVICILARERTGDRPKPSQTRAGSKEVTRYS